MIQRPYWIRRIEEAWKEAPIVWLCGVRRTGKTTLLKSLGEPIEYLNCDLPSVEDRLQKPELFYRECQKPVIVFDEIHQLGDPSRILKIGADHFPHFKILATGSSTLSASKKFRDTLTGRKRLVHFVPILWTECREHFKINLMTRLFHGGLPPALLAASKQPSFYREWIDSFFARDIQRLFAFRNMNRFNLLFEYLLKQSGGLLEVSSAASQLGISRPTVESHVQALEITQAITRLRPFHSGGKKEIVKMPKIYAFDTGFVSFARGWDPLRPEDAGHLWEHLVLEHLQAHFPSQGLYFWRSTSGHEIDFVLPKNRDTLDVIECKWDPAKLDPAPLKLFRSYYPKGSNFLVSPISGPGYTKAFGPLRIKVLPLEDLL